MFSFSSILYLSLYKNKWKSSGSLDNVCGDDSADNNTTHHEIPSIKDHCCRQELVLQYPHYYSSTTTNTAEADIFLISRG